ncbi:MAG: flagellar filament capping protein FliD [Thermodesulfobacteriota bacterium]
MVGSISSIGIGSGLQLQDILEQLREVDDKTLIQPKKDRITTYQAQIDEFTVVENKLFAIKSAALDLSLSSTFLGRSGTSSNEDVLTVAVSEGSSAQSASITVTSLAQKSSWMSASGAADTGSIVYVPTSVESSVGVADPALTGIAATDGTLVLNFGGTSTITVDVGPAAGVTTMNQLVNAINSDAENIGGGDNGRLVTASTYVLGGSTYLRIQTDTTGGSGEAHRVTVASNSTDLSLNAPAQTFAYKVGDTTTTVSVAADTTLAELVDLINDDADNPGVTASIIDDGGADPYRLVLQAGATGENNRITLLSQLPDLSLAEQAGAGGASLNARFTVDGIAYQRQANSFNDVLDGVTLTLKSAGTATATVAADTGSIRSMIISLVEAYNDVTQEIRSKTAWDDATEKFGILAGTTLREMPYELQNLMTRTIRADADGNIRTMFDLGLEFSRDGTISINTETLDSVLANFADGVKAFFLGDADAGITGLADLLNDRMRVLTGASGQIDAESSAAQERIDALELQITAETERLDRRYELMTKQFIELDRYMNQMTSISDYLASQFDALNNSGSGSK